MTRAARRAAGLVAALSALAIALGPTASAAPSQDPAPDPFGLDTPVVVVMDTSGSMIEAVDRPDGAAQTRIEAARAAVLDLIVNLGSAQPFGLVAYPGREATLDDDGCSTGRVELDLADLDTLSASAAVRRLTPDGDTPTAAALTHAADLLRQAYGDEAAGVIVLVSDGESNCGPDPCEIARDLRTQGLDVQVNTVGLYLEGGAADEMRCVADATNGTYIEVGDGTDLEQAIGRASQAALEISVDAPDDLPVVSGDGLAAGSTFTVTVDSNGRLPAGDVRVSLHVDRDDSGTGSVLVTHPVRFLGNLSPGDDATAAFTVRPDDQVPSGSTTWTVTATAKNADPVTATGRLSVTDTLDPSRLGGVLDGVTRVVVLGDSYSSGEGTDDYQAGTDSGGGNACHRSDQMYAGALWGEGTTVIACSGAVTGNLFGPQRSGDATVGPQLLALRDLVLGEDPPQAVLVSIGGNDAGFGSSGMWCVLTRDCGPWIGTDANGQWNTRLGVLLTKANAISDDVHRSLTEIDRVVNDTVAVAHRGGELIPVIAVPYPSILPLSAAEAQAPGGCFLGISGGEIDMLNAYEDAINTSVSIAAYQLRSTGRPVYVAEDVIRAFRPDHTVCEGPAGSYARVVTLGTAFGELGGGSTSTVELLHPNLDGHRAMARALVTWSQTRAAQSVGGEALPEWSPQVVRRAPSTPYVILNPFVLQESVGSSAGSPVYVRAEGFAPGTGVVILVESEPIALTGATADQEGTVAAWVRLPADLPTGAHHLVVSGVDPTGVPLTVSTPLRVLPQGGPWLYIALVGGVLMVLAGTGLLLGLRRSRRSPARRSAFGPVNPPLALP